MAYALYNPATHVAVPREPTPEMLRASSRGDAKRAAVYYRAMLAAAPPHVVEGDPIRAAYLAGAKAMQNAAAKIASARLSDGKTEFNMGQNASAYGIASEIWRIDHEKVVG